MKLAVFASGGGSNFEALCTAVENGELNAEVALCISDRPSAGVLDLANSRSITTAVVKPRDYPDASGFGAALVSILDSSDIDFIVLAGYLRKIPDVVVQQFLGRLINIHPSLLPAFGGKGMYGRRVHQAVLDYGSKWTGATVHLVDTEYDTGPVVLQGIVPVHDGDTAEILAERVLAVEHRILPEAVQLFADNRLSITGRNVIVGP